MKGTRMGQLCLLAAVVAGTAASPGGAEGLYGVHGLPEIGRCDAAPKGVYKGSMCISVATGATGKYNFLPVTETEKPTFTGSGGETRLVTVAHPTVKCLTAKVSGEWTGAKTATVHLELQGCVNSTGHACQTEPVNAKEIKSLPLEGEIGFIKNLLKEGKRIVVVGLDLKPQMPLTDLMVFECGGVAETIRVEGSVIGRIQPIDKMTTLSNLVYARASGEQSPQKFEGLPADTLTTTFIQGTETSSGASTLSIKSETGTSSVALEIKAK
jgi:hypothetical protein